MNNGIDIHSEEENVQEDTVDVHEEEPQQVIL